MAFDFIIQIILMKNKFKENLFQVRGKFCGQVKNTRKKIWLKEKLMKKQLLRFYKPVSNCPPLFFGSIRIW